MTPPLVKQHLDRKLVLPILRFITLGIRGMDLESSLSVRLSEAVMSVSKSGEREICAHLPLKYRSGCSIVQLALQWLWRRGHVFL